jgi:hypothetical protein
LVLVVLAGFRLTATLGLILYLRLLPQQAVVVAGTTRAMLAQTVVLVVAALTQHLVVLALLGKVLLG